MTLLACLLVAAAPQLARTPDKTAVPDLPSSRAWVYFTDKGVFDQEAYDRAVELVDRTADAARRRRRLGEPAGRFDFDDLPVRASYIRRIEELGGRLLCVSRWLNAASFELPGPAAASVYRLPFVYDVKPVASRSERAAAPFRLEPGRAVRARAVDTAEAHRFYGPSYDQAEMMGVPDLFFRGYFGSGVRLAMFDSGLKLNNVAVRDLVLFRQHDFLSGDQFHSADAASGWQPVRSESLGYLGLVRDPALFRSADSANTFLAFVADSFAYGYNPPRRAVFASRLDTTTGTWSAPVPIALSAQATQLQAETYENLDFAGRGFVSYLAFNNLASDFRTRPRTNVYVGHFVGGDWVGSEHVGPGRSPKITVLGDTLLLATLGDDSTVTLYRASIVMAEPVWGLPSPVPIGVAANHLELSADDDGVVVVVVQTVSDSRILMLRSTDRGATFAPATELAGPDAQAPRLARSGDDLVLLYQDASEPPFTRLAALHSDDRGATWTERTPATDSTLSLGGYAAEFGPSGLELLYESAGIPYRTSSPDHAASWESPVALDSAGFCDMPALLDVGGNVVAAWVKRGDDNVVDEPGDSVRFSRVQADHGTRMASIIAGYQQGSIVGIAPGVDLLVAKTELHRTSSGRYYEYNMEEDTYIEALEWAEANGADIVSTSLGYRGWYSDDQFDGRTAPISVAASLAARRGMVIVTAMGNRDTLVYPWPGAYIVAPADADGVVAAGGVERNLLPWRGTGTGPTSDGRCKPELVALSDTVAVAAPDSISGLEGSVGTSCATALIAGAFALLKEAHPHWTAESLKAVMFATATNSVPSCTFGYGVPQVDSAFSLYPPDSGVVEVPEDGIGSIFPNPFIASEHDRIYFPLRIARKPSSAEIRIYTVSGALVDTFSLNTDAIGQPGQYTTVVELDAIGARWDGMTLQEKPAASGLYLAVYSSTFSSATARFSVVR